MSSMTTFDRTLPLRENDGPLAPRPVSPAAPRQIALLAALCLFVGLVSTYDTYLTVKYQHYLHENEVNPICRWIMALDQGPLTGSDNMAVFLALKFGGGAIVLTAIPLLFWFRRAWGLAVGTGVGAFQLALAVYLTVV
jgi:hypothetical protein